MCACVFVFCIEIFCLHGGHVWWYVFQGRFHTRSIYLLIKMDYSRAQPSKKLIIANHEPLTMNWQVLSILCSNFTFFSHNYLDAFYGHQSICVISSRYKIIRSTGYSERVPSITRRQKHQESFALFLSLKFLQMFSFNTPI